MSGYDARITFALDKLIAEGYFSGESQLYVLSENATRGESKLTVNIADNNLCIADVDGKKQQHKLKCNFTREPQNGLNKAVDHAIFQRAKGNKWILHLIEMKTTIGRKTWDEIKLKFRASLLDMKALAVFLGIDITEVKSYTTYETYKVQPLSQTPDLALHKPKTGEKNISLEDEWSKGCVYLIFGELHKIEHKSIKMTRVAQGQPLLGTLTI